MLCLEIVQLTDHVVKKGAEFIIRALIEQTTNYRLEAGRISGKLKCIEGG